MWYCPKCKSEIEDDTSITCWNCGLDSSDHSIEKTTFVKDCSRTCKNCGSEKIIRDASVFDIGNNLSATLQVGFHQDPNALIFKDTVKRDVSCSICCECGIINLNCMGDLNDLWDSYNKIK